MFKSKIFYPLMVAGFLASSSAAHATVQVFDFGKLIKQSNAYSAPDSFMSNPFAKLLADDNGGSGTWTFTLTVQSNLIANFGPTGYLRYVGFNYTPTPATPPSIFISSNLGGVTATTTVGGLPAPGFVEVDFGTALGLGPNGYLQQNDNVIWNLTGLGASTLTQLYIQTADTANGHWAKYVPLPVPEPETYAMVLAGLGLLGFTARRRRNNV